MASNFPLVDIFVTTYKRPELLRTSLKSLNDSIDVTKTPFRLTLIVDGVMIPGDETLQIAMDFQKDGLVDHLVTHRENLGLGPSINQALGHIQALNEWHVTRNEMSQISEFVCYCQDDLLYTPGWLQEIMQWFTLFEHQKKLGFASGVECVEHKIVHEEVYGGTRILTKDWIRAANMFARRSYWMSMYPIPGVDPETGRLRAKPNDGMGSGVDWWFIRNHENSVCRTGRKCLVLPGLIKHAGYKESTWLARELPESEKDKDSIRYEFAPKIGTETELVECGTYGCREMKKKNAIFCESCYQDYIDDPDAYK